MMADISIPEMMDTDPAAEWTVVSWLFMDGAMVQQGELVCEVMAEKTTVEIESPVSGRLVIIEQPDAVVKTGAVIGRVEA